jgi:hypothetical protein
MRYNVDVNTDPNSWLNDNASHVSPAGETSPDMTRYVLTIEEASQIFAEAGVPRAPRTITRFCALGDLDCLRVETEKNYKYLIDRNSVEKRIKQLQQVVANANKTYQDKSRHVQPNYETQPDMSRHDEKPRVTEQPNEEASQLREKVEELETEIIHLKIDKAAKEQVINMMNTERKGFIGQLNNMSFQLGEATAKLQQLEAPRPEPQSSHVQTTGETGSREAEVVSNPAPSPEPATATSSTSMASTPPTPTSEPTPAAEKKGNFFSRLFNS